MYKIGKIVIRLKQINGFQKISKLEKFLCNDINFDFDFQISYLEKLPNVNLKNCVYKSSQLIVEKDNEKMRYFHLWNNNVYAVVEELKNAFYIYLYKQDEVLETNFVSSLFHLERPLIGANSMVLHSSYIEYQNRGILFTAASGGGKSTQAYLWQKYKNAEILNGDKNLLGKDNDLWKIYGLPYSGSSEYCENKTNEIGAIIILEKGLTNKINKIGIRGFQKVFSQIIINPWDKEFCEKIIDLTMDLCSNVPIYVYSCTKDECAVETLYEQLVKDGVFNGNIK